jgi:hypothetical protein
MPRCVFKFLWDRVGGGEEIFAYVVNMASNGDHYWVFAHVTPSFDERGAICGFHSNRRVPDRRAIQALEPIYAHLRSIEEQAADRAQGLIDSTQALIGHLQKQAISYDEFIFSLSR